jgi:hypothetical protein
MVLSSADIGSIFATVSKNQPMKKLHIILIVLVLSQLIVPSCSKKSSPAPTCQIITILDQNGATSTSYNITYNNQGQISTEQYSSGSTNTTKVFTYSGNTEMIATATGAATSTDSITLTSDGLMARDVFTNSGGQTVTTYTFSGQEVQKSVTVANGGTPTTTVFNFTNGDLTSFTDGTNTTTVTYNSKPTAAGDYWQVIQLVNYGAPFVKTTHQLAGISTGTMVTNVNYTYDNSGKVTALAATSGASIENISYQYSCN